ncbi:MAG: hypothetical protein PHQ72_10410 [Hespellia sp.]|nr:hypothetical protein [Hespellia sp.]
MDEFLDVQIKDGSIMLSKTFKHKTLEERAAEFDGKVGPYDEFSWGDAEGSTGRACSMKLIKEKFFL